MIKSLLIANRGEIACRIIRTARRMGIRTIAVYSQADSTAMHVRMADEAHLLGPAAAADSYLRAGRILKIATEAGADAIHPGYGFLSENADFAQMTADAGMVFVGPPPDAIRAMGLKDRAKEIMSTAGVPVVPGFHGENQDPAFLKRKAFEIGYPVLIKAVAGGGGKGMRHVAKAIEFDDALEAAKREAQAAFGNDIVLIEKFIASPRHIEVQVFGDSHGNVVHLLERDCSLQRRHQKVIEEAPAPGMTKAVREAMGKAACDAALAVNYQGAGTVEFIVDGADGLKEDGFWFMEMNTRLQVEHPVTEMITGQDLVEWQLRVAHGEALPLKQDDIAANGHAVEARVYAEDANAGFLPSTGKLVALELGESDGVRIDSGVEQGDTITPYYDPMIAKVIAHAPTRREALDKLHQTLTEARIAGPITNTGFLAALAAHKAFMAENFDTGLIDRELDTLLDEAPPSDAVLGVGIAALLNGQIERIRAESRLRGDVEHSPWATTDGFQLGSSRKYDLQFRLNGKDEVRRIRQSGEGIEVRAENDEWTAPLQDVPTWRDEGGIYVIVDGRQWVFRPAIYESSAGSVDTGDGAVRVPMHGRIIAVTVANGDTVEQGDMLFSVEAMKMEHAVLAPFDGTVGDLSIETGSQVENGHVALVLEPDATVEA